MEHVIAGLSGGLRPSKNNHEAKPNAPLVNQAYETKEAYVRYGVEGSTNKWEYSTNSLSTLGEEDVWWSLPARFAAEFAGTTLKIGMDCVAFMVMYNSSFPAGLGLLSGRFADYAYFVLATFVIGAVTHADFFGDSCKFDPFISLWSIFVAQSRYIGWGFNISRFLVEIIAQFCGALLGAGVALWLQPITLQRTYLTAGIPFYDGDITTQNQALGMQILAYIFISYTFARIQYGLDEVTRMESKSMLMGAAYAGAGAVTYYSGGCTSFFRWLGTAIVTGVYNIQTDTDTTVDAGIDNVFSPGWLYLVGPLVGTAIGIFFYTIAMRPQKGTNNFFNYKKKD